VHPDTTVDQALELLVSNSVTGMPVLDDDGVVVGVVSDYDLLSLEGIAEQAREGTGIFPELSMEWNTFRAVQRLISKNSGKTVADVMTEEPLVVRPETNMAAAAKILLDMKVRRLPVVDDAGRLLGIFTRRDVIKAALATRKAAQGL
jgi:CBS domain-containing protein